MSKGGDTRQMRRIARRTFGYADLSSAQEEVIHAVLDGEDTLAVMPTGSGKSAAYQIAGLMRSGFVIIISPLLALQQDQVEKLTQFEIGPACVLNSRLNAEERAAVLAEVYAGRCRFLLTAPEQFHNADSLAAIREARPVLFVVDEAHCISDWGEDFRPDFLRLGAVIEALDHPPVLALTATASSLVREDIIQRLGLRSPHVVVQGFDRPNIRLESERFYDEVVKREALLERVCTATKPGIVYVATRQHAEEIAGALVAMDQRASFYHAGMNQTERERVQEAFMSDEVDVLAATSAFGLGVDKPNVRFVFHYDIPESVDSYYQEVGRAGRDGEPALATLFYRDADLTIHHFFAGGGRIEAEHVESVLDTVSDREDAVSQVEIQEKTSLSRAKINTALTRLEDVGALEIQPSGEVVLADRTMELKEVAEQVVWHEERRRMITRSRIDMMRRYAELTQCRREFILNYFGEPYRAPCGMCDNCERGMVEADEREFRPFALGSRVTHSTFGTGEVERYDGDSMTVLFEQVGYKTLLTEFVLTSDALQPLVAP